MKFYSFKKQFVFYNSKIFRQLFRIHLRNEDKKCRLFKYRKVPQLHNAQLYLHQLPFKIRNYNIQLNGKAILKNGPNWQNY